MNKKINRNRYILLPATNSVTSTNANPEIKKFLARLDSSIKSSEKSSVKLNPRNAPDEDSSPINIKVIDSIQEDGAKLVEIEDEEIADFKFSYPGLRIIPRSFMQGRHYLLKRY